MRRDHGKPFGGLHHFPQGALVEEAEFSELLIPHLFVGSALQLFRPRLMDDMGDFVLAEVASEAFFPFGYGGIPFFGSL
jgi:hypothetical protein